MLGWEWEEIQQRTLSTVKPFSRGVDWMRLLPKELGAEETCPVSELWQSNAQSLGDALRQLAVAARLAWLGSSPKLLQRAAQVAINTLRGARYSEPNIRLPITVPRLRPADVTVLHLWHCYKIDMREGENSALCSIVVIAEAILDFLERRDAKLSARLAFVSSPGL